MFHVDCKQGHSQDFTLGATETERRRRDNRGPESAERGGIERGPTHFWHIWGPQNTSGRENSVTLLNKAGPMSQQSQFWGSCPFPPLWLLPWLQSTVEGYSEP